jgi:phosphoribosyl 1,2-cyclic phosphodiesterase
LSTLEICTLASGSSGNSLLAKTAQGAILVDAGISCKRVCDGLKAHGVDPAELSGIVITHEHSDHISGLTVLLKKYRLPIYTSAETGRQLCYRIPAIEDLIHPVKAGEDFQLGGLELHPFHTPHDAAGSLGFSFYDGHRRASIATDFGYVTDEIADAVRGSDFVLMEANYEEDWLLEGSYPYPLKQRILGDHGHLSNADGAELACYLARNGTKNLVLGHLSKENNSPDQAYRVVSQKLLQAGVELGKDMSLSVAPRSENSPVWTV